MEGGSRIIQITREMATEVLLMAQSLRRRGPVLVLGLQRAAVVAGLGTLGEEKPPTAALQEVGQARQGSSQKRKTTLWTSGIVAF